MTPFDRFKLWKEYEKVAMHFNDLLIKLRSQSLGAVAAFATLAGVVAKSDLNADLRWEFLAVAFILLILFWIAVWVLDMGYYNRLLAGAVDALLVIEKENTDSVDRIELSTKIDAHIRSRDGGGFGGNSSRIIFYVLVLAALLLGLGASIYQLRSASVDKQEQTSGASGWRF